MANNKIALKNLLSISRQSTQQPSPLLCPKPLEATESPDLIGVLVRGICISDM